MPRFDNLSAEELDIDVIDDDTLVEKHWPWLVAKLPPRRCRKPQTIQPNSLALALAASQASASNSSRDMAASLSSVM